MVEKKEQEEYEYSCNICGYIANSKDLIINHLSGFMINQYEMCNLRIITLRENKRKGVE